MFFLFPQIWTADRHGWKQHRLDLRHQVGKNFSKWSCWEKTEKNNIDWIYVIKSVRTFLSDHADKRLWKKEKKHRPDLRHQVGKKFSKWSCWEKNLKQVDCQRSETKKKERFSLSLKLASQNGSNRMLSSFISVAVVNEESVCPFVNWKKKAYRRKL